MLVSAFALIVAALVTWWCAPVWLCLAFRVKTIRFHSLQSALRSCIPLWVTVDAACRQPDLDQLHEWAVCNSLRAFVYFGEGHAHVNVSHYQDVTAVLHANPLQVDKAESPEYLKLHRLLGSRGLLTQAYFPSYALHRRILNRGFSAGALKMRTALAIRKHASALIRLWATPLNNDVECRMTITPQRDVSVSLLAVLFSLLGVPDAVVENKIGSLTNLVTAFRRLTAAPVTQGGGWFGGKRDVVSGDLKDAINVIDSAAMSILHYVKSASSDDDDDQDAPCLLKLIVEASREANGGNDNEEVTKTAIDHIKTFLFAGFDTSSNAVLWGMSLLAEHPAIQADLAMELREVIVLNSSACQIDVEALRDLPLLNQVVKEILRLYPPAPTVFRTVVSKDGFHLPHSQCTLPQGSVVTVNIYSSQRSPIEANVSRSECEQLSTFNPSRQKDDDSKVHGSRSLWLPFSGGLRSCIGREMAQLELMVYIAAIVHHFTLSTSKINSKAAKKAHHVTLSPHEPFRLALCLRQQQ